MPALLHSFFPRSLALTLAALFSPACNQPPATSSPTTPTFTVSIPPQAHIIRRIAGNHVNVNVFVPPGQDPHHFSATPRQVVALAESRAFFTIGMPFESSLLPKIRDSLPALRIVNLTEDIALHANDKNPTTHNNHNAHSDHKDHADHEEHDHDHEHGADPHVWLSPPYLKILAQITQETLAELDPANAALYTANLQAYLEELDTLHAELTRLLEPCRGKPFYVYHPAFSHFAETYGLRQEAVEAGGKSPTPKQLMHLIDQAKAENVKVIFVQPQFDPASAKTVADAIGGVVASIDPLAENVTENLRTIAKTIHESLAAQPTNNGR